MNVSKLTGLKRKVRPPFSYLLIEVALDDKPYSKSVLIQIPVPTNAIQLRI